MEAVVSTRIPLIMVETAEVTFFCASSAEFVGS